MPSSLEIADYRTYKTPDFKDSCYKVYVTKRHWKGGIFLFRRQFNRGISDGFNFKLKLIHSKRTVQTEAAKLPWLDRPEYCSLTLKRFLFYFTAYYLLKNKLYCGGRKIVPSLT